MTNGPQSVSPPSLHKGPTRSYTTSDDLTIWRLSRHLARAAAGSCKGPLQGRPRRRWRSRRWRGPTTTAMMTTIARRRASLPVYARRRGRRPAARRRGHLDSAGSRAAQGRRHAGSPRVRALGGGERRALSPRGAARDGAGAARTRALCPRRRARAAAGARVLLPLPRGALREPHGPHADGAAGVGGARAEVWLRLLPGLAGGLLPGVPRCGRAGPRPGRALGRLHLRVRAPSRAARACTRGRRCRDWRATATGTRSTRPTTRCRRRMRRARGL